jgi:hypothetical protein
MFDCGRSGPAMTCLNWPDETGVCKTVPHAMLGERCGFTCYAGDNCSSTTIGGNEPVPQCFEDDGMYCDLNHRNLGVVVDWTAAPKPCRDASR